MKKSTKLAALGAAIVVCSVAGLPNLYDKYLIGRYLLSVGCLLLFFIYALFSKKELLIPKSKVFQVLVVTVLFFGLSIVWALNTGEAVFTYSTWLLALFVIILFYTFLSADYQSTRRVLWICSAMVLVVYLGFAIGQMLSVENSSFEQLYNVSGINGHKNLLSVMLFLMSVFLLSSIPFISHKVLKITPLLLFFLSVAVIVLLKSRAALLSVFAAGACFGLLLLAHRWTPGISNRVKTVALVVCNIIVIAFFVVGLRWFAAHSVPQTASGSGVESNMMSTSSLVERCILWDKTYHIVDKHPVLGCGIGNWQIFFPDASLKGLYRSDFWNVNFTKPHNEYLGILSEGGYLGLVLFLVFLTSLVVCAFFRLCEVKDRKEFLFGAIVLGAFVGSCVDALFDFPNSRIEHLIWIGIICALLFRLITGDMQKALGKGWTVAFLVVSVLMLVVGCYRYKGERNTFDMQQALKKGDWAAVEHYAGRAITELYTIDPLGLPLYWYRGKAAERLEDPHAYSYFRLAYRSAPYCRENLNDLGLEEFYVNHNLEAAEFCFREAIRISPGYLYSYFNLAYIYLSMNEVNEAHMVMDQVYMSEEMRDFMMAEALYSESVDAEAIRQKIAGDYEATVKLRQTIAELEANK